MVMCREDSPSRNPTTPVTSCGWPTRPSGIPDLKASGSPATMRAERSSPPHMPRTMDVMVVPGATTFARTP